MNRDIVLQKDESKVYPAEEKDWDSVLWRVLAL